MKKLPLKFVLPINPAQYLQQGPNHCGVYTVKGIMSALGRDIYNDPREYHVTRIGRLSGSLLPGGLVKILLQYNLHPSIKCAQHLKVDEKIDLLKEELLRGFPVIVAIGNGYKKDGSYSWLKAKIVGHWISLWGYNDLKKIFYAYDSSVPKTLHDKTLSVGNVKRTYSEFIRDWYGSFYMWKRRYLYITICNTHK